MQVTITTDLTLQYMERGHELQICYRLIQQNLFWLLIMGDIVISSSNVEFK